MWTSKPKMKAAMLVNLGRLRIEWIEPTWGQDTTIHLQDGAAVQQDDAEQEAAGAPEGEAAAAAAQCGGAGAVLGPPRHGRAPGRGQVASSLAADVSPLILCRHNH